MACMATTETMENGPGELTGLDHSQQPLFPILSNT